MSDLIHHFRNQRTKEEIAKLKKAIEVLKTRKAKTATAKNKSNITISIQLLILHYLDILNAIPLDNIKKGELLAIIFNTPGSEGENIRKKLSNPNGKGGKVQRLKNLQFVYDRFQRLGLTEQLKKIESDIKKINS